MSTVDEQIRELGHRWEAAEVAGDTTALDALTTDDFTLVGPLGFVLTKPEWLHRYQGGGLVTSSAEFDEVTVRDYGSTAIAIGKHTQKATYQGHPTDGVFRVTQIAVRDGVDWKLAGLHYSPIGAPPAFTNRA